MSRATERPHSSEKVDLTSGDHSVTAEPVAGMWCNAAGTIVAKLRGDSSNRTFVVVAGSFLPGDFETIVAVGTDADFKGDAEQLVLLINQTD